MAEGRPQWTPLAAREWELDSRRFHESLAALDDCLASMPELDAPPERLFQGPLADALTHVGQLALLCRIAGVPVKGENFFVADVRVGQVGPDQPEPRRPFR